MAMHGKRLDIRLARRNWCSPACHYSHRKPASKNARFGWASLISKPTVASLPTIIGDMTWGVAFFQRDRLFSFQEVSLKFHQPFATKPSDSELSVIRPRRFRYRLPRDELNRNRKRSLV